MDTNYSSKFLNSTFVDIYVKPRMVEENVVNTYRNLNLTWNVTDWNMNSLKDKDLQI